MLYTLFASRMYGVCLRYYPNRNIANDILQDGFIKVFQNIGSYRFEGSLEGWIRRIMVNTALEYHRKKKDEYEVNLSSAAALMVDSCDKNADYEMLLSVISELPNQYRLVFNLYAIEGYSHNEIAKQLSITESTSKSNYSRARAILRQRINELERVVVNAVL